MIRRWHSLSAPLLQSMLQTASRLQVSCRLLRVGQLELGSPAMQRQAWLATRELRAAGRSSSACQPSPPSSAAGVVGAAQVQVPADGATATCSHPAVLHTSTAALPLPCCLLARCVRTNVRPAMSSACSGNHDPSTKKWTRVGGKPTDCTDCVGNPRPAHRRTCRRCRGRAATSCGCDVCSIATYL